MQRTISLLVVLWALLVPSYALATIVVHYDLDALTTAADVVVVGHVEAQRSKWEGARIVTDYEVRVSLPVVGASGSRMVVRTLGGRVGEWAQMAHGVPQFKVGQDVLLFLERDSAGDLHRVIGMAQGRLTVARDAQGRVWAVQDLAGLSVARVTGVSGGKRSAELVGPAPPIRMELGALLAQIDGSLEKVGRQVRPEVRSRLGEDLDRPYDFLLELRGEDR
jgi:hypothetical protein